MVSDTLRLLDLVPSETGLPVPVPMDYRNTGAVAESHRPRAFGEIGPCPYSGPVPGP